jgi:hypothetical protein
MTTGPLTVEPSVITRDGDWSVYDSSDNWVASFKSDADARAFVALPALQYSVKRALELLEGDTFGNVQAAIVVLTDALAQADGPAPKE